MPSDRRTWLLGGAVVIVLAAVGWALFGSGSGAPSSRASQTAARRGATGSEAPLPAAESVRLAALEQPRDEPLPTTRNPFLFGSRSSAPGGRPADPAPALTSMPAQPQPPVPAGPPPPPPIALKFIGVVEKADGTRLAVLVPGEDDGPSPFYGTEGDIIDGRYRLLKIGTESLEIAYLDGRGRQTLPLTGQ